MNKNWKTVTLKTRKSSGGDFDVSTRRVKVSGHDAIDVMYDLSRSPTGKSNTAKTLREFLDVTSCTYIIFKREDYDKVGTDLYSPLNGYVGETKDFVGRMNDIRMSFNNPKYSVYHGLGRYFRRNNIGLNDVVCRIIPADTKSRALELEQHIQTECRAKFGLRFAWEDGASSGKGSAVHKALDLIECIEDPIELDTLVKFIQMQRKVINGKKVRSN